jgi:sigma-E factor negative regulatory protein RseA
MKDKISALMDGELFEDEAQSLITQIKSTQRAQQDWQLYHLIGDVLRQPDSIVSNVSQRVSERLAHEPTILAPRYSSVQKIRNIALSAAASVLAVSAVAWMSLQSQPNTLPALAMSSTQLTNASFTIKPKAQPYLMAHQELSPSSDLHGGASNLGLGGDVDEVTAP